MAHGIIHTFLLNTHAIISRMLKLSTINYTDKIFDSHTTNTISVDVLLLLLRQIALIAIFK